MTDLPRDFCSECKKPIKVGDSIHGLTGEHYKCYERREARGEKLKETIEDIKWKPKPDKLKGDHIHGWLAPDGKFYGCLAYVHIALGNALAKHFYGRRSSIILEENGWAHISDIGCIFTPYDRKPTQAQLDTLFDWLQTLTKSTEFGSAYTCLRRLLNVED